MDGGTVVPLRQVVDSHPPDLPPARCEDPGSCLLFLLGLGAATRVTGSAGATRARLGMGRRDPGSGSIAHDGSPAGWETFPIAERGSGNLWKCVPGGGS